ncbi:MAG: hypothetical protein WC749_08285 [Dehalococcoidia bacterium]
MAQPLSHEWAQIYFYLGTKEVERDGASTMPADIRVTSLTRDEERYLADLRQWIYDRATEGPVRKAETGKSRSENGTGTRADGDGGSHPFSTNATVLNPEKIKTNPTK